MSRLAGFRLACLLIVLFLVPVRGAAEWRSLRLENGLEALLVGYRMFPVASLGILYDAGARHDPPGRSGLAHLTEHLMFRGTPERDVARALERMGASFNAVTYEDRVLYYETFPSEFLDEVLALEADRMRNTILSPGSIETEKRVVFEERMGEGDGDGSELEQVFAIGRAELQAFYRDRYRPEHARIVLVGDFGFEEARSAIERRFASPGEWVDSPPPARERVLAIGREFDPLEYELERESPLKTMLALAGRSTRVEREAFLGYRGWLRGDANDGAEGEASEFPPTLRRHVLPNGLRVLLFSHPGLHTLTVEGYVPAGSYFESPDQPGLAVLTSRVMSALATETSGAPRPGKLDFSAVSFNTYIEGRTLPGSRRAMLARLASLVRAPDLTASLFERVRDQMIEELRRRESWVELRAFAVASRRFYPRDHVFHVESIADQIAAVTAYTLDDVRDFHRRNYRPDGAILVLAGGFDAGQALAEIGDLFGGWRVEAEPATIDVARVEAPLRPAPIRIEMAGARRAHVLMAHPGGLRRTDPDYYAGLIANVAVGGSALSSRLGRELRDRLGLVYEIGSVFFETTLGDGLWGVSLDVGAGRAAEAVARTRQELERIRVEGLTEDEALFHRSTTRGAFLVSLSIPLALAGRLLDAEFFGLDIDYIHTFPEIIDGVSPADVNRAIREHFFPDRLLVVEIRPR